MAPALLLLSSLSHSILPLHVPLHRNNNTTQQSTTTTTTIQPSSPAITYVPVYIHTYIQYIRTYVRTYSDATTTNTITTTATAACDLWRRWGRPWKSPHLRSFMLARGLTADLTFYMVMVNYTEPAVNKLIVGTECPRAVVATVQELQLWGVRHT